MSYQLNPGNRIESEVRRIVEKELRRALENLQTVTERTPGDALRNVRQHVKKVRAVVRLVQRSLGRARRTDRRLRAVKTLLGPAADSAALLGALSRVAEMYYGELPSDALEAIRSRLIHRQVRTMRKSRLDGTLTTAADLLTREWTAVREWRLSRRGFDGVRRGLEQSMRETRRAMATAIAHPTARDNHTWRRTVKALRLQIRLIQARCEGKLAGEEQRLTLLDGWLGEAHDCALLAQALAREPVASRAETAQLLRLIRRYRSNLLRQARRQGRAIHSEKPAAFVARVRRYWRHAEAGQTRRNRGATALSPAA